MRKMTLAALAAVAVTLAWSYGQAAVDTYKGTLSSGAEVPPVTGTTVQGAARRAFTERSVCLAGRDDGSGDDPAGCSWGKLWAATRAALGAERQLFVVLPGR